MRGGEDGPVVVPGKPELSRLIEAVSYGNPDLQMPPKNKLSPAQIAAIVEWVKAGAFWPKENAPVSAAQKPSFDFEKRRREHWAWQPIRRAPIPKTLDARWPATPVDSFILGQLEKNELRPAVEASPRVLIRRLYFDLTGLPPPPEKVEEFSRVHSAAAYAKIVDELLASPRFGERWARHWLDLVRYAETCGHEFDYPIPSAWRYRDYVIRAFNADVPYDRFVTEQIAGDLLEHPRLNPDRHFNESMIGTAFYQLGQRDHSPVDVRQDQADIIDNEIDVMSKAFLGLTVACARCHDHKFDAISQKDFYSLYGVLESSRYAPRAIDSTDSTDEKIRQLRQLKREIRREAAADWLKQSDLLPKYVLTAAQTLSSNAMDCCSDDTNCVLNTATLSRWIAAMTSKTASSGPFDACLKLVGTNQTDAAGFTANWNRVLADSRNAPSPAPPANYETFATFSGSNCGGWFQDGEAFANAGTLGDFVIGGSNRPVTSIITEPCANDAVVSRKLEGALRSPAFDIRRRFVHVRAAGRASRVRICVDNFVMIRDPIYGGLKKDLSSDAPGWITFDLDMWKGHKAYIEFCDFATPDPSEDRDYGDDGFISVSQVLFSDLAESPPAPPTPQWSALLGVSVPENPAALATKYQGAFRQAVLAWSAESDESAQRNSRSNLYETQTAFLNWMLQNGLLDTTPGESLKDLESRYHEIEASIPKPTAVPAMADGDGFDERVFIRGNHKTPGSAAPRRFLAALSTTQSKPFSRGSGRLELAHCMTDPSDPLLARVMVNRVWQHLFGRGIVQTPDDFGAMGQPPTNPQLLDWLADWYRTDAHWSTKSLIRLMVTSSVYKMSGQARDQIAESKDPENLLLHKMPVRRLEGEAIRDAMLAVSGRLDEKMFGPPVPIHLTEFMDGPGRPKESGPLDGAGRRSIYIEVRRNFLSPMMRNFDAPVPFTTIGRRTVSNVPAQSLILLNDPFVYQQAQLWARTLLETPSLRPEDRLQKLYEKAFSRRASKEETADAMDFIRRQGAAYGLTPAECGQNEKVWTDVCHVIFNLKEFIFIE